MSSLPLLSSVAKPSSVTLAQQQHQSVSSHPLLSAAHHSLTSSTSRVHANKILNPAVGYPMDCDPAPLQTAAGGGSHNHRNKNHYSNVVVQNYPLASGAGHSNNSSSNSSRTNSSGYHASTSLPTTDRSAASAAVVAIAAAAAAEAEVYRSNSSIGPQQININTNSALRLN